jgi:hypothetical protein
MKDYKEFQWAWIIFVFMIPVQIMVAYFYYNDLGDRPLETGVFLVINLIILLIYLLFYGLTIKLTTDSIRVSFGIGIISRRIQLGQIKTLEIVKNPWYYGWGIRFIPKGMLYNISGSGGIELTFTHTHRVVRIGTKDPINLKQEIEKRLGLR